MNGFSLIFAVVLILSLAAVSGVVILMMLRGIRVATPPWRKRKSTHPTLVGHRG